MTDSTAPEAGSFSEVVHVGNGSSPSGETVGVDKIRDLLFGNQCRITTVAFQNSKSASCSASRI